MHRTSSESPHTLQRVRAVFERINYDTVTKESDLAMYSRDTESITRLFLHAGTIGALGLAWTANSTGGVSIGSLATLAALLDTFGRSVIDSLQKYEILQ